MTERMRVVVSGATGRMGRALASMMEGDPAIELVGGIARSSYEFGLAGTIAYPAIESPEDAEALLREAEVLIDFSSPELFRWLVSRHREALTTCALVIGTTGLEAEDLTVLDQLSAHTAVLPAANFSVGVNLLVALAEQVARVLGKAYDVEIVEAHHRRKADAPSGTALQIGAAVARGLGSELQEVRRDGRKGSVGERPRGEIGLHAIRGGDVVGEHRVLYLGERERVELAHVANDRALFAEGALRAARWVSGRAAGMYSMRDVLGLT
jgi:4-hydroxy-tetrahydrodipicolinate reductase